MAFIFLSQEEMIEERKIEGEKIHLTVHRQDRSDRLVCQRRLGIRGLADRELARLVDDEPGPPGAELGRSRRGKLLAEVVEGAEVAVDGGGQGPGGARLLRGDALPVEGVVPHLRGVVEGRRRLAPRPRRFHDFFDALVLEVGALDLTVEVGDVGAVVLAPMELDVVL